MNHLKSSSFAALILVSVLFSCGHRPVKQKTKTIQSSSISVPVTKEDAVDIVSPKQLLPKKDFTELHFDLITLWVHTLETGRIIDFDGRGNLKDTMEVEYDLPESVEGQSLFIKSCELQDVKIEFRYETSITLNMEGPHWDLYDWKHYYSDWKELKPNHGEYKIPTLTLKESQRFPKYKEEELKQYVNWDTLVAEYPDSEIGIYKGVSRVYIRITGIKHKKKYRYIISFYEPMGC